MNIIINAVFADENMRGPGRYCSAVLKGLAEIDNENEYYIYYGKWMKNYPFMEICQDNFHFIELDISNNIFLRNFYLAFLLPLKCKSLNPDVFMLMDTQALAIKPSCVISTIHDLIPFSSPENFSKSRAFIRRFIIKKQVRISDYIFTVSNFSKEDICSRFSLQPEDVRIAFCGIEPCERVGQSAPDPFFLFVGPTDHSKNLTLLIEAFSMLDEKDKERFHIKVVGKKDKDYEMTLQFARDKGVEDKVQFYGYLSDEKLLELYRSCYAFVFPSVFEGFGLPVLEAMNYRAPVICSRSSSIPEVCGEAGLLFDPSDPNELKAQMELLISHPKMREKLIELGAKRVQLFPEDAASKAFYEAFTTVGRDECMGAAPLANRSLR